MKKTYQGSCHCGAVRFEADRLPADLGEQSLADYQFGRRPIRHRFCKACGVRPFWQSGNQLAVRVNCLDGVDARELIEAPLK